MECSLRQQRSLSQQVCRLGKTKNKNIHRLFNRPSYYCKILWAKCSILYLSHGCVQGVMTECLFWRSLYLWFTTSIWERTCTAEHGEIDTWRWMLANEYESCGHLLTIANHSFNICLLTFTTKYLFHHVLLPAVHLKRARRASQTSQPSISNKPDVYLKRVPWACYHNSTFFFTVSLVDGEVVYKEEILFEG